MIKKEVMVRNKLGMHARAASKFVTLATRFSSHIELQNDEQKANGKSIMGIMMLAAAQGSQLQLSADGEDEAEAVLQLEDLINNFFGEGE